MSFKKITAMITRTSLDRVSDALRNVQVTWITVCTQRGHGENPVVSERDWMSDCVRIEIFSESEKTKDIVEAIGFAAYEGKESNGMIAVESIEEFMPIKDFKTQLADMEIS
jgi:nitrogen regulatory protein PII